MIETKEFSEVHLGAMISEVLVEVLAEWNLNDKKLVVATMDNGSNIARAIPLLGWHRISCFSHMLQLSVNKVIKTCRC